MADKPKLARKQAMQAESVASQVLAILRKNGPMMRMDICLLLGRDINDWSVSEALTRMRGQKTRLGHRRRKLVYIKSWDTGDVLGESRHYPRPVYAPGNLPDADKPKPMTSAERSADYKRRRTEAAQRLAATPNSVFALARLA